MKKVLALLLIAVMMVGVLPALTFTAMADGETTQKGLTATVWQTRGENDTKDVYWNIIGTNSGDGNRCSYDDTQRFDASIDRLKMASKVVRTDKDVTEFPGGLEARDGYLYHWTGTMTADADATYWFAAKKIDNGFVAVVNGERKYEYWAAYHWFDSDGQFLISNKGSFDLKAGEEVEVEFWYLETNGGEGLDVGVVTAADAPRDSMKSLADAGIKLNLTKEVWYTDVLFGDGGHNKIKDAIPNWGVNNEGQEQTDSNGCPAWQEQNHQYDDSIEAIKKVMTKLDGTIVRPNYEIPTNNLSDFREFGYIDNNFLVEYDGYVTPYISGTYEFGTNKVDNCLMVEITDEETEETTRVYEFWAKGIWNDNGITYSGKEVELEAGKSYKIHVAFLEINGGEAIDSRIKIDGKEYTMATSSLIFTVDKPTGVVLPSNASIFANANDVNWHYTTSGEGNKEQIRDDAWMTSPYVYGEWPTHTGTFSSDDGSWPTEKGVGDLESGANHQSLWAVAEFDIEDVNAYEGYAIMASISWDDNIRVYINGNLVMVDTGWSDGTPTRKLVNNATDVLRNGTNTLAVKLVQGWGGASFGTNLYVTSDNVAEQTQTFINIATPEELVAFAAEATSRGNDNKNMTVNLTADIDMTGVEWTPVNKWVGKFYGNGHTISGLSYTATVDATTEGEGKPVGLMFTSIANDNANGRVVDLILENCTLTVNATEGSEVGQQVLAGVLAGMIDRGFVENVTVKGCAIKGNPGNAAGIAGVGCWGADNKGYHIENCAVLDSTITATNLAAGIVAYLRSGDNCMLGNMEVKNVTYVTENKYSDGVGATWGWGERSVTTSEEFENNAGKVTLGLNTGERYKAYEQTRAGSKEGTTDVRVIIVVNDEWIHTLKKNLKVKISFTDGKETKSIELSLAEVYSALNAKNAAGQAMSFVGTNGVDILGWTITDVPDAFAANHVTVSVTVS